MGYYSEFKVESSMELTDEKLKEISGCYSFQSGIAYEAKWYNCQDDMKKLSQEYPTENFTVYRIGEVSEDFEVMYFKNGECHSGQGYVVWPTLEEFIL